MIITIRARLSNSEKILIIESRSHQSSNWANFWQYFLGTKVNCWIFQEQILIIFHWPIQCSSPFFKKMKPLSVNGFYLKFVIKVKCTLNESILNSSKVLILGPQMAHLLHFGQNMSFSEKRASSLFSVYWILTSFKKIEKSNEPILRKRHYRRTNGWTDKQSDRSMDGYTELNSQDPLADLGVQ